MNNQNNFKISHLFKLPNLDFKTQMNISIDQNVHIKNIINVQSFIYDCEPSAITGKCNIKGKLGVKIVYLDTDNVYNTIVDETSFLESIVDDNITQDCKIFMNNENVSTSVDFDNQYLKLTFNVNAKLYSNINVTLNLPDTNLSNLVTKKTSIKTSSCLDSFNNTVSENYQITLPQRASKILNVHLTPYIENVSCFDGYITISGKTVSQLIYEIESDSKAELKLFSSSKTFKIETQLTSCDTDCIADLTCDIKQPSIKFTTELNEQLTDLNIDYDYQIAGCIFKNMEIEAIEDLYSTENEIETNSSSRQLADISNIYNLNTNIEGEIQLADDNIDEIIESVNHSCLITQAYVNENKMIVEGVISSRLIYFNEEREIKSMQIEMPFSLTKDSDISNLDEIINYDLKPLSCKCKIKRGSTLMLDYEVAIQYYILTKHETNLIDKINIGKSYEYGDIAFQIMVAKPDEDIWQFCKRAHISQEKLMEMNKETPPIFQGGEKIVIYR